MKGFGNQTNSKKNFNNLRTTLHQKKIMSEAIKYHSKGNILEAKKCYQKLINDGFEDANVFNNYGILLIDQGKLKEAELLISKSIELNPEDPTAYANLGGILIKLGKLEEAELLIRQATRLNPDFANAHYNLGNVLKDLGKLKDAELSIREAIRLKPNFANAFLTLGNILKEMGKLEEAELSARKAIQLYPNLGNAYLCLGIILRDLANFEESELFTRKAIELNNTDLALCYRNLSLLLFIKGNLNEGIKNIEKAASIDPISKDNKLLVSIFSKRKNLKDRETLTNKYDTIKSSKCSLYPIIINKPVDPELINSLYKIKALDLNKFTDPSVGKAKGSDYMLFDDNKNITNKLQKDLITITKKIVNSDVFFRDSFFTILGGKSKIIKHNHIGDMDKLLNLNLWKQKYSLVYYLSVGDQGCQNPGILKFYKDKHEKKSNMEIMPSNGMIVIFPADRYHSVKYDGSKDRIIIGVNFYSI